MKKVRFSGTVTALINILIGMGVISKIYPMSLLQAIASDNSHRKRFGMVAGLF
jgi:hypothetical protein